MIKSPLLIFFVILSLIVAGLIMAAGVFLFIGGSSDVGVRFKQILLGIYFILFGFLVAVMEVWAPPSLASQIAFYQSWLGKGLSFIFIGLLVVEPPNNEASNFGFWAGLIPCVVGVIYVILQFVPVPRPQPVMSHT